MQTTSVLIVEDEGLVADDLQQSLTEFGFDAFAIADSADEAIRIASDRCPDVVLMDIRINGDLDGIEAAALIREQFGAPVVFLTAHSDSSTLARAQKAEPYAYLTKPVRSAELRSAVELAAYRCQVERRLRERDRSLSSTLHAIGDAVITVDLAGRITFMNTEAEQLTGMSGSAMVGRPSSEILKRLDSASRLTSSVDRALETGRAVVGAEPTVVHKTGAARTISDIVTPVVDGKATVGAVMVLRDVTSQHVRRELELADRLASLGTLASGVAHEINNPLTVVATNAAFTRSGLKELVATLREQEAVTSAVTDKLDDLTRTLDDLVLAGGRIARTIADLRMFTVKDPPPMDGADLCRAVDWALSVTALRIGGHIRVTTALAPVPRVVGDESRLGQVLVNLLLNAAQAIPLESAEATIHVAARAMGGRVEIEVTDTGTGIPPEIRDRIFEPFFTTKAVGVGAGLGLSIAHGTVTSFGGTIAVESHIGRGTTVRLELAVAPIAPIAPIAAFEALPPVQSTRRARILAVDDEPMILRAVARMLDEQHDVTTVENPIEALRLLDEGEHFDVILSDLMMPRMTGIEFFEVLLQRYPEMARCTVFVTGGGLTPATDEFLRRLPNGYLEKPFDVAALKRIVATKLSTR